MCAGGEAYYRSQRASGRRGTWSEAHVPHGGMGGEDRWCQEASRAETQRPAQAPVLAREVAARAGRRQRAAAPGLWRGGGRARGGVREVRCGRAPGQRWCRQAGPLAETLCASALCPHLPAPRWPWRPAEPPRRRCLAWWGSPQRFRWLRGRTWNQMAHPARRRVHRHRWWGRLQSCGPASWRWPWRPYALPWCPMGPRGGLVRVAGAPLLPTVGKLWPRNRDRTCR